MKWHKQINKRQLITFYLRDEFVPIFYEFRKLISKDPRVRLRISKHNRSLTSIGLCTLMEMYVKKMNANKDLISPESLAEASIGKIEDKDYYSIEPEEIDDVEEVEEAGEDIAEPVEQTNTNTINSSATQDDNKDVN